MFPLFHTGAVGKVDIEQQSHATQGIKHRQVQAQPHIAFPDKDADHHDKAIHQQENQELRKNRIAHEAHLGGELDSKTFKRFVLGSVKGVDPVGIVHATHLVGQILRHLIATVAHAGEREQLVGYTGTAVEGTTNHAFGAVLLTFHKIVEGLPVFTLEQVAQLQVALLIANVDFRVVLVDDRVQFRTYRNIQVSAVTDKGKEGKGQGKTDRLVHVGSERLCHRKDGKHNQANQGNLDKSRHHINHGAQESSRNPDRNPFHNLLGFSGKQKSKDCRHRKHSVEVGTDAEEGDIADENQNLVTAVFIFLVVPD